MKRPAPLLVPILLSVFIAGQPAAAAGQPLATPDEEKSAAAITEKSIRADVRFLASDLLGGRGPASEGDRLAQLYIASRMEGMGLEPAAPGGGWIQKVPLVGITSKVPDTMTFTAKWEDPRPEEPGRLHRHLGRPGAPRAGSRTRRSSSSGYGIVAPEYGWNDYKDADLKGKVLLMMNNDPEEDPAALRRKNASLVRTMGLQVPERGEAGRRRGAHHPHGSLRGISLAGRADLLVGRDVRAALRGGAARPGQGLGDRGRLEKIAALGGQDLDRLRAAAQKKDFRPVPLGVRLSIASRTRSRR